MTDILRNVKSEIGTILEHYRTRPHVDAVMAAAALVAAADGEVSLAERVQRDRVLDRLQEYGEIDTTQASSLFDDLGRELTEGAESARERAWAIIGSAAAESDDRFRCQLVRVACAVGIADGELTAAETRCIEQLCEHLGITREACGV